MVSMPPPVLQERRRSAMHTREMHSKMQYVSPSARNKQVPSARLTMRPSSTKRPANGGKGLYALVEGTCLILLQNFPSITSGDCSETGLKVNTARARDETLLTHCRCDAACVARASGLSRKRTQENMLPHLTNIKGPG